MYKPPFKWNTNLGNITFYKQGILQKRTILVTESKYMTYFKYKKKGKRSQWKIKNIKLSMIV